MKLFSSIREITECQSETVHDAVIASLKKSGKVLSVGDQFMYLEVRTVTGIPTLVNCVITVRADDL